MEKMQTQLKDEASVRGKILEDADIIAVLNARKAGKEISVVPKERAPDLRERLKPETSSNVSVDQMSNAELLNIMIDAVDKHVSQSIADSRTAAVDEFAPRIATIESNQGKLHTALIQQAAAAGVTTMRTQFPDFDTYSEKALEIMNKQGLSIEDSYYLAKARAGSAVPDRNHVETERPSSPPQGRPALAKKRAESLDERPVRPRSSQRRFRELVNQGVDTVLSHRDH